MTGMPRLINRTRRKIILGGPVLVGIGSSGILTACGGNPGTAAGTAGTNKSPGVPVAPSSPAQAQAQAPTFSPAAGTYTGAQSVSLATQTSGATIYYTADGTAPTTSSIAYASPITVSVSETIQAIAAATGMQDSAVGSAIYTINSATSAYDGIIAVSGAGFMNGAGKSVQLRGANMQQTFAQMIVGSAKIGSTGVNDCTGAVAGGNDQSAQTSGSGAATTVTALGPDTSFMANWKFNCVRIGLNEASVLGYTVYDLNGVAHNPNNYGSYPNLSYLSQIAALIAGYNAINCYVILVLAGSNPGRMCPIGQDLNANQDNSIQCWTALADAFGYPNGTYLKRNGGIVDDQSVIFEMYNEPQYFSGTGPGNGTNTEATSTWQLLMNGGFQRGAGYIFNYYGFKGFGSATNGNGYAVPVDTPNGGSGSGNYFTPGENFTASNGTAGRINCYHVNTTAGYQSSGTQWLHIYNLSGTNISGGVPSEIPMPPGTKITGSSSGATCTITSTVYPGQTTAGQCGWYMAGHSQLLAAVRTAGAWNPCLIPGTQFEQDLSLWAKYAPADTTAPTAYNGPGWTPQVAASWHPYLGPGSYANVTDVSVANGGSGYAVNDTILLAMDESGDANSGNCYYQTQLKVTSVSGGTVTGVSINTAYIGGTPGKSGGNPTITVNGGAWSTLALPSDPVGQYSSSGSGTGATFNLTFTTKSDTTPQTWPDPGLWSSVVDTIITGRGAPVVITETGDHYGAGVVGSPFMKAFTSWCDANGVGLIVEGYLPSNGWSDVPGGGENNIVYTVGSTRPPTPGYGAFMYNWFVTHTP